MCSSHDFAHLGAVNEVPARGQFGARPAGVPQDATPSREELCGAGCWEWPTAEGHMTQHVMDCRYMAQWDLPAEFWAAVANADGEYVPDDPMVSAPNDPCPSCFSVGTQHAADCRAVLVLATVSAEYRVVESGYTGPCYCGFPNDHSNQPCPERPF